MKTPKEIIEAELKEIFDIYGIDTDYFITSGFLCVQDDTQLQFTVVRPATLEDEEAMNRIENLVLLLKDI